MNHPKNHIRDSLDLCVKCSFCQTSILSNFCNFRNETLLRDFTLADTYLSWSCLMSFFWDALCTMSNDMNNAWSHFYRNIDSLARYLRILASLEYNEQMYKAQQKTLDMMVDMCADVSWLIHIICLMLIAARLKKILQYFVRKYSYFECHDKILLWGYGLRKYFLNLWRNILV